MPSKSLFQSKTFWFNLLTLGVGLAPQVVSAFPHVNPQVLGLVVGVGNIILRLMTNEPAHLMAPKE